MTKPLGDKLGTAELQLLCQPIGFLKQRFFDAHGDYLRASPDARPADFSFCFLPLPPFLRGGRPRFIRNEFFLERNRGGIQFRCRQFPR
jgi:hypothetical protein